MISADKKKKSKRPLLEVFERSLQRFPIAPGDKILVAVSGGPDSVCLLHLLRGLSERDSFSLHVAHLNHRFRKESEEEARFVEALSRSWGIPITVSAISVPEICKERRLSKQEGARQVRYEFFRTVAREVGARWIALGHTADDQAETFLMRLLRGAGPQGLGAIPALREGSRDWEPNVLSRDWEPNVLSRGWEPNVLSIIRPLLEIAREEILFELSKKGISFVEDASNQHPIYLRNRIRHELLPFLERYNPKIREIFCREAELLREESDFMRQATDRLLLEGLARVMGDSIALDIGRLQALHPALRRRLLRWGVEQLQGSLRGIGFKHVDAVVSKALAGPTGKSYLLPRALRIEKRYSELLLEKRSSREAPADLPEVSLPSEGAVDLPDWGVRLRITRHAGAVLSFSTCAASFDFDKITLPLYVRRWRAGDRLTLPGMKGSKKLQDFFVDAKIPRAERGRIPLLACAEGVLWIMGLRVNTRFWATEKTRRTLAVEIEPPHIMELL